jgi:hypothetical protein
MVNKALERTDARPQRPPQREKREVAFVVRAKTGPHARDWQTVGVAFERKNNEPGFSIKLNTLPIDRNWNGSLVMVPPYVRDDEMLESDDG